mgnify:CR=1 FL=1
MTTLTAAARTSLPGRWVSRLPDARLRCELCPRHCLLREGQRGWCHARFRDHDELRVDAPVGALAVDPIEKKPLFHFYPGTPILSLGTPGCCLACRFCQNWELSRAQVEPLRELPLSPEEVVSLARREGCPAVAFTYSEPLVVAEWVMDVARACREAGLRTVAVTSGYVTDHARADFFGLMDATNVDLKGFTEDFYLRFCGAKLQPVLETLQYLATTGATWLEVTTLLIPGVNDAPKDLEAQFAWHARTLGVGTPLHLSAFHPAYRM